MSISSMPSPAISGIHHVTAIAGDPQKNYDFYTSVLGLRFVKKTVNFDDPYTYHFYFGNKTGEPGTILTFFPWSDQAYKSRKGTGQITTISFTIAPGSIEYWSDRLKSCDVNLTGRYTKFDEEVLLFEDHDGFELELIASGEKLLDGWDNGKIPAEHSIRGFHSVTFSVDGYSKTEYVLAQLLGFSKFAEQGNRLRYKATGGIAGLYVDILNNPGSAAGRMGVGAIHHIAFRTEDEKSQLKLRKQLVDSDLNVTPVVDRQYFHSIYFREPGNILLEIATDVPGFSIDEDPDKLGKTLKLPKWYEEKRQEIEKMLPPLVESN